MDDDSEFFAKLGGTTVIKPKSSEPFSIDLRNLFAEPDTVSKDAPVRTTERAQPETISKMGADIKSLSRLITEYHTTHTSDIKNAKTELEKRIEAEQVGILRNALEKLSGNFDTFVKNSKNRVETRIDYRETNRLDGELKNLSRSLESVKKMGKTKEIQKVEVRVDEKEIVDMKKEIKNLAKLLGDVGKYEYGSSLNVFGNSKSIGFTGLINFKNGSNTTAKVTLNPAGGIDVEIDATGGGGTATYNEVVAGSGTAWTLAGTPIVGSVRLYANGQRLTPTVDYSITGAAITTVDSWAAGTILADYNS